jgi:hypothetical protein
MVSASTHARNLARPNSASSCWPNSQKKTMPSSGQIAGSVAIGQVTRRHTSKSRTSVGRERQPIPGVAEQSPQEHRRDRERTEDVGGRDVEVACTEPAIVRSAAEDGSELVGHRASRYPPVRMLETS